MNMNNRRLKVNFWGKYEDELRFAEKENNKKRIRELFALSYVNYLDSVLTPVENFGIRNEAFQELSFKEKLYSKHFSGGTKVYCYPSHWGDGYENIHVIGKPRKSRNLIMIVLDK